MEDALAPRPTKKFFDLLTVLILVVMEDALARDEDGQTENDFSGLNPCCNGRCSRTKEIWI